MMIDVNEFFENGYDFEALREKIDKYWAKHGLKDKYLRNSYEAMLTDEQKENLFFYAASVNAQTKKLLDRGGMFTKKMLKRNDERFLSIVNAGLDVNVTSNLNDVKINLLNQAIRMSDYNKVTLLLAAGAKPTIDLEKPQNDSLTLAVRSGDLISFALLTSYLDKPLGSHWLVGVLTCAKNPSEQIMGRMLTYRCEQLGDNLDNLISSSLQSFEEKFLINHKEKCEFNQK